MNPSMILRRLVHTFNHQYLSDMLFIYEYIILVGFLNFIASRLSLPIQRKTARVTLINSSYMT